MIKLTPIELESILYCAIDHFILYPKMYKTGLVKAKEIHKWLTSIEWEDTSKDSIMIDELPF